MPSVDRNLSLLFLVNLIVAVYWNMTGTFNPLFIRSLDASVFQASLVLSIGGLVSTMSMLPGGLLCDKYRRRTLVTLSTTLMVISPLVCSFANSWEETILYVVINSIAFSLFTPARMIMIADSVTSTSLATTYGLMNLAWPIGGIVGPLLGGFLADNYGWTSFFYSLCIIALVCVLLSLFIRESSKKSEVERAENAADSLSRDAVLTLAVYFLIHAIGNTARGILGTVFPFYLTDVFHKSKIETGLFFSVGFGVATLVTQLPSGFLADRLGRKRTMVYSVALIPLFSLLFPFTHDYLLTLIIYTVITALWSATWPASAAYLMDISSTSKRGLMMGGRLTAVQLGFTVGPLVGGFLWSASDPATSFYTATFFFASSFILVLLLKE